MTVAALTVEEEREKGNEAFKKGDHKTAAICYSKALRQDTENAALYSNRCAAFTGLFKYKQAISDADMCIKLKPEWSKGYFRKAKVHAAMKEYGNAFDNFEKALLMDLEADGDQDKKNPDAGMSTLRAMRELYPLMKNDKNVSPEDKKTFLERVTKATNTVNARKPKPEPKPAPKPAAAPAPADGKSAPAQQPKRQLKMQQPKQPPPEVLEFFVKKALHAVTTGIVMQNHSPPSVFFHAPSLPEDDPRSIVTTELAYQNPETLAECVGFLRQHSLQIGAEAAIVTVQKKDVAYPRVWQDKSEKMWPYPPDQDGVFLQLETPHHSERRTWYIPIVKKNTPGDPAEFTVDQFGLTPPLFQSQ